MALTTIDRERIDAMSHLEMARIMRFGSLLDFPWVDPETGRYFMERWNMFEGTKGDTSDSD